MTPLLAMFPYSCPVCQDLILPGVEYVLQDDAPVHVGCEW